MAILYREAVPEDAEALLAYCKLIGGESDNLSFGAEGLHVTEEQEAEFLKNAEANPNFQFLLALDGDEIVGTSSIEKYGSPRYAHRAVFAVSVRKSHWHQGIGSGLMERQLAFAKEAGAEMVELEVRADNVPALGLYQKFGFVPFGTYPRFFKLGGEYFDAVYMTKIFEK